jgi:hypothetical protein
LHNQPDLFPFFKREVNTEITPDTSQQHPGKDTVSCTSCTVDTQFKPFQFKAKTV